MKEAKNLSSRSKTTGRNQVRSQQQLDLFDHVAGAYAQTTSGRLTNEEMYRIAAGRAGIDTHELAKKSPIGKQGAMHSTLTRALRWRQQTLASMGFLVRVPDARGVWEITQAGRDRLRKVRDDVSVLAFSTELGIAIWSNCSTAFRQIDEPIFLALSSPPYPLRRPRAYGNPPSEEYIDFILKSIEPVVRNLVRGGNVVLSLGDVFEHRSPAKSTYIEELTIALRKHLGLSLMNRIVWRSNKPPGPVQWASKHRMQLNEGYEFCLWYCNDPGVCIADNRRVLEPHTETHRKLIARGGENRTSENGDGAYRLKHGSYSSPTAGRIPRNVFDVPNYCASQRDYKRKAKALGLAAHGATMPLALARKIVRFMTDVDQTVADMFGGSFTTALASELEGRRWLSSEYVFDYVRGGAERFVDCAGFELHMDTLGN